MQGVKRHFSSSSILQAIEDMGLAGIWAKDLVTGEQYWSAGFCRILGHQISSEPMSFEGFLDRIHPDDRKWISDTASNEFHLLPSETSIRILQKSGLLRWAHIRSQVLFSPTGDAICMLFIAVDITDKQQTLETLAQLDRHLAALAKSFLATLFTVSPDGKNLFIHNWLPMGLPSRSTFSSMAFLDGVVPEDKDRAERHWIETLREKKRASIRFRRINPSNGDILDMAYFLRPVFKEDNVVREWVGLAVMVSKDLLGDSHASHSEIKIKGAHVRAARALLDWSIDELASRSGVSASTIRRIEGAATLSSRSQSLPFIRQSLESSGVEFSQTASGSTAVGLRR